MYSIIAQREIEISVKRLWYLLSNNNNKINKKHSNTQRETLQKYSFSNDTQIEK